MDIIATTESFSLKQENNNRIENAQDLRKNVLKELKMGKKISQNLTREQRKALKEIKENKLVDIYLFDKGNGFVRIEHEKALERIRDQIGQTKVLSEDPTSSYAIKIKTYISQLNKKQRFSKTEYDSIYPSDPIPPRMYGLIKANKPEKAYPMRIVVSTIGTPNYGISNYLVKAIQPILNKNKTRLKNSFDFINKADSWNVDENEVQVSFDVINLYPSIPLKEATLILIDQLNKDDSYRCSTKLTISETKTLIELCLHRCYFLWNNEIHELENSGPIGLSFMVVLAESFLQHHEENAFKIAKNPPLDLKSYLRYVDDSHARFSNIQEAEKFKIILNKQHPAIQYTIETENHNKTLNFLNITIINNSKGKYEFKVYRKEAITNIQIKPHSNHDPKILCAISKGYVHRAYSICSVTHLKNEINFLIQVFNENGFTESQLKSIANQIRKKRYVKNNEIQSENNAFPTVSLPWIPSLSLKLRIKFRKVG
ncbi:uncharacterized protein LOC136074096 [Hydra vulgaris]|uniref:Uncharacterized protein LOC136074096 n=1 Tax=Hydra vulgaris TaxID=6087 RepID=A0ABM4B149_HYDVU